MGVRNVPITPGSGDNVAFDDNTQLVKQTFGPAGTQNLLEEKPATEAKQTSQEELMIKTLTELSETNEAMLLLLRHILAKLPAPDGNLRQRVAIETTISNMSTNVAQWGGQTAASGQGNSGNGVQRVTPAGDTTAGSPHVNAQLLGWGNSVYDASFRSKVTL